MAETDEAMAAEPFELMQCFYRRYHAPVIRFRADLDVHIDIPTLKQAVDLSAVAAPLILVVFDTATASWRNPGYGADDVVVVTKSDDPVDSDDPDIVESALLSSLAYDEGPRLKIQVIRGAEKDSLCIIVDHMICDGAGFKEYLYLLAGLYSAIEKGSDAWELVEDYPTRRDFGQVRENIGLGRRARILLARGSDPKPDPSMRLPLNGGDGRGYLARTEIGAEDLGEVRTHAKSVGATVNDMFLTAYARMLRNATGCSDVVLPCPVDLRKYGRSGQRFGICNLTSNYYCHLDIREDEGFDETLGKTASQMREQKAGDACLKGPILFHVLASLLSFESLEKAFFKLGGIPVISYSNLGILDEKRLAFGTRGIENAFLATALKHPPSFQLSVSTFRGSCTMSHGLFVDDRDIPFVDSFLEGIKAELLSAQPSPAQPSPDK